MMRFSPYAWSEKDMIGGNAALDFVNTASEWSGGDPLDRLGDARGFGSWAKEAGLLLKDDMTLLETELSSDPEALEMTFTNALALRATLWRIFHAIASDRPVANEDLQTLDQAKVRAAECSRIVQEGDGFRLRCKAEAPALQRAIRLIVEDAEELLLNGRLDRLHACGGKACEWLFLDTSKNGRRRWCDMARCGNEAKVRKFRKRSKDAG